MVELCVVIVTAGSLARSVVIKIEYCTVSRTKFKISRALQNKTDSHPQSFLLFHKDRGKERKKRKICFYVYTDLYQSIYICTLSMVYIYRVQVSHMFSSCISIVQHFPQFFLMIFTTTRCSLCYAPQITQQISSYL